MIGTAHIDLVEEARKAVEERGFDYGGPLQNHTRTSEMWGAYLSGKDRCDPLTPRDVCMMNILQKVSRDINRPIRDTLVDIVGYAMNVAIADEQAEGIEDAAFSGFRAWIGGRTPDEIFPESPAPYIEKPSAEQVEHVLRERFPDPSWFAQAVESMGTE